MFNWLKTLLGLTPNPYTGLFVDWHADKYRAQSPNHEYSLWIANDFYGFKDDHIQPGKYQILNGLSRRERGLVYDALMHDLRQQSLDRLQELLEKR